MLESFFQLFKLAGRYFPKDFVISNLPDQTRPFNFVNTLWFWSVYIFKYQRTASSLILGNKIRMKRTTSSSYFKNLKELMVFTKELIKNQQFCWQSFTNFNIWELWTYTYITQFFDVFSELQTWTLRTALMTGRGSVPFLLPTQHCCEADSEVLWFRADS